MASPFNTSAPPQPKILGPSMDPKVNDPTRVHNTSTTDFKSKFREGAFAPNPYREIQRRAAKAVGLNEDGLAEHNLISPSDQIVLSQINKWQNNFPEDIVDLGPYVEKTMGALRTKYTKAFYFWTAYSAVKNHLETTAVGENMAQKQSALIQSEGSCPGPRAAYAQCSDIFHSIDITTRLSLPLQHQVTCREPFIAVEQCIEHHMRNWSRTMRAVNKLQRMNEYKEYYLDIEKQINGNNDATIIDDSKTDSEKSFNMHLSLFQYDPDLVTDRDVQVEETLFEVKRLFPQEYLNNKDYYTALQRPMTPEQVEETKRIAKQYQIDYSQLHLDTILFNLDKQKNQAKYENQ